ncbi:flavin reductase [Aurantimonas sp. MSK8Z-1]|uniref:flavin reductase n=1 Tax=Mangrovibrevibacter kandeliae TaxID=2968473 RepID=UPI002117860C|nr:flavin reductase [Aurantimonas sp. MSK8Z-1]MCW4114448.1 flavin reductase [Aurantimonas sp. MSK8Z-1]
MTTGDVDRAQFRDAMARHAAAVTLVTTDGPAGRRGVTVTSACSVSDDPAILLVCLNTSNALNQRFLDNGVFAVNVLSAVQEDLARDFSGGLPPEQRFDRGDWDRLATGAPTLPGALVSFDCRLRESQVVATHRILFGEVVALRLSEPAASLVYRDRRYRHL